MLTVPLIVNHKTDPEKVNGLVTSSFAYLGQLENGDVQLMNVNLVVWPNIPTPLHHKEADENLVFVSVYDMNSDEDEDDDDDDDEIEFEGQEGEEGEEYEEEEEEEGQLVSPTPTTVEAEVLDAEQPNN